MVDQIPIRNRRQLTSILILIATAVCVLSADAAWAQRRGRRAKFPKPPVAQEAPALPVPPAAAEPSSDAAANLATAPAKSLAPRSLRPRLAVMGLRGETLEAAILATLEDTLGRAVSALAPMDVVTTTDLRAVLSLAEQQQLMGCADETCTVELGDSLSVQQMVWASVRKVGDGYLITAQRFDVVNQRVLGNGSQESSAEPADLVRAVRRVVPALFNVVGQIVLWEQPSGAEVFLNGVLVGPSPVGPIIIKEAGAHDVSVQGPGLLPWQQRVDLEPGEEARLRVQAFSIRALKQQASARRTGALLLGGGGLLGLLGSGALLVLGQQNNQRLARLDRRTTSQETLDSLTAKNLTFAITGGLMAVLGGVLSGAGAYGLVHNPAQKQLNSHHPH